MGLLFLDHCRRLTVWVKIQCWRHGWPSSIVFSKVSEHRERERERCKNRRYSLTQLFTVGEEEPKRPSRLQQNLNSELILSKEQLYDMFQQILGVKKFEHQLLYNVLQVRSNSYRDVENCFEHADVNVVIAGFRGWASSRYSTRIGWQNAASPRNGKSKPTMTNHCDLERREFSSPFLFTE